VAGLVAVFILSNVFLQKMPHSMPCRIKYISLQKIRVVALGAGEQEIGANFYP